MTQRSTTGELANYLSSVLVSSGPRFAPATADAPATAAPLSQGKDRCPERRELKANIIVRTRHIIEPVNTARPITGLYRNNSSGQQQVSWQITCHVPLCPRGLPSARRRRTLLPLLLHCLRVRRGPRTTGAESKSGQTQY